MSPLVRADLHTHSTASDGQYSPAEVVQKAKNVGVQVMALTDHDTTDGIQEAAKVGKKLGIQIIRGIELSAKEYPSLHILGYGFRENCPHLKGLCQKMVDSRNGWKYQLVDYLKEKDISLDLEEVEQQASGVIGRPHFAQVMVRHGYVRDSREAFDRYLDTEEYHARLSRFKPDAKTCIDTIHADGGIASWAHPYQVGLDFNGTAEMAKKLAEMGIDAIECFYPRYTPEQTAFYCALTDHYGLYRTGGSDFHGEKVKPDIHLIPWLMDLSWMIR